MFLDGAKMTLRIPLVQLYLARKPCWPRREATGAGGAVNGGPAAVLEVVRPAFSYKCTAYVLWRSGAEKLLVRSLPYGILYLFIW